MRQTTPTHRRGAQGFSIIELMVSVSIVVLLIGISYPFLNALNRGSRVEAGLNIVGMSADVARQWVQFRSWANDGSTDGNISALNEAYSGTAAIYCPTGEVRLVFNFRNARNGGAFLEDNTTIYNLNGYQDMPGVDYIRIPDGVGIVGIKRTGTAGNAVDFIAPPFAIAFNELGQLSFGDGNGEIHYDGDGDGDYEIAADRNSLANYDPADWTSDNAPVSPDGLTLELPFEAIECVPGVVVFNLDDYTEAGFDFAGGGDVTLNSDEGQWLRDNGRTVFFSPLTGAALRDEDVD
ncbi:MAG: prepilin-type N-terminal cleavage/methylation domain-containing protein [Planctomycetota bacterium]